LANKKSALKAMRVAARRRARNRPIRSAVKTYFKRAERAIAEGPEAAVKAAIMAQRAIDKAVSKGVIHRNTAARRKSRLMKKINAAIAAAAPATA
jgi:small subunit ribosomal protein S20